VQGFVDMSLESVMLCEMSEEDVKECGCERDE